jgi:hypothetical protein
MEMKIMQSRNQQNKYQQGNIMLVLLAVVTLVALVAYTWNAGSKDANSSTDKRAAQLSATTILDQAAALSNAFSQYAYDGRDTSTNTVKENNDFGKNESGKLFFSSYNYGVAQTPPSRAFTNSAAGIWYLNTATKVPGIGSDAADYVLALGGLSLNTCRAINNILYNTDSSTATPGGSLAAATGIDLTTGQSNDTTSNDLSISGTDAYDKNDSKSPTASGKDRGCLAGSSDGSYTYYQVIYAQ